MYRFKGRRLDNGEVVEGYYKKYHKFVYIEHMVAGTILSHRVDPSTVELIGEKEIGLKYVRKFVNKLIIRIYEKAQGTLSDSVRDFIDIVDEQAEKLIKEMGE